MILIELRKVVKNQKIFSRLFNIPNGKVNRETLKEVARRIKETGFEVKPIENGLNQKK